MVASVQELILAAQSKEPDTLKRLADIISGTTQAYQSARDRQVNMTRKIIEQKMLQQQLEGKKQMDAEYDRELKAGFNGVKEPNDTTRAGKFQREWKVDQYGNKSYSLKPVEVPSTADDELKRAQAEYYRFRSKAGKQGEGKPQTELDYKIEKEKGDKETAWNLYQTAKLGLMSGLEGTSTGYFVGKLPPVTAKQQTAEGGVSAMAPVLKQIFRVAGEGVFTDRDQALLIGMVPTREDLPEARKEKIANIDRIVAAKLGLSGETPSKKLDDPQGTNPIIGTEMEFESVEEAEAANLPVGTRIKIGGRAATVR